MLNTKEIKAFLDKDKTSALKRLARIGQDYYEGNHDILQHRIFFFNSDGQLVEDKYRSNAQIPHPFFTELVDQATQFVLSNDEGIVASEFPELQEELDIYFNKNKKFMVELSETITGCQAKGFDYLYAFKGSDDRLRFENADALGVVEVEGRFASDKKDQYIYKYLDVIDKDNHKQWKIINVDDEYMAFYKQTDNGEVEKDDSIEMNPAPLSLYEKDGKLYTKAFGFVPFFRLDNNKKRFSSLKPVKPLIDDYDLMASSLTNNLIDFDTPIHVVRGFQGDNLDELQTNLKTKKMIGVDEDGGIDVKTVDVPYQARKEKLEIDEKNIYKFGMGLNMSGLKDTSATTNIAIKAAYSLLELRCNKIIDQVELFLEEILKVVLNEINERLGTGYQLTDIDFTLKPEIMTNAAENAQIELTKAQKEQTEINTILNVATMLDNETVVKELCAVLDINYDDIKDKLPDPDEAADSIDAAGAALGGVVVE